jgi:hypothetical protein
LGFALEALVSLIAMTSCFDIILRGFKKASVGRLLKGHAFGLFFLLFFTVPQISEAKNAVKASGSGGVLSQVSIPKAKVYEAPDFDSKVLTLLPGGRQVYTSSKSFGESVRFYKIRIGNKIGYISTIEVRRKSDVKDDPRDQGKFGKKSKLDANGKKKKSEPLMFSRFFGLQIGSTGYRENIPGIDANTNMIFYGAKLTGPDVLVSGPIIDLNFNVSLSAPSYYTNYSLTKPTGVLIWLDTLLLAPLGARQDSAFYLGVGPTFVFSYIQVVTGGESRTLSSLNVGATVMVGAAYRAERLVFKAEAKQVFEKKQYTGFLVSLQSEL